MSVGSEFIAGHHWFFCIHLLKDFAFSLVNLLKLKMIKLGNM